MSALEVSTPHITFLITAALADPVHALYWGNPSRRITLDNASEVGAALVRENQASMTARYGDRFVVPATEYAYPFAAYSPGRRGTLDPVEVLKACQFYDYQSCEHDGWEASAAQQFTRDVRDRYITLLPGYDGLPWGID